MITESFLSGWHIGASGVAKLIGLLAPLALVIVGFFLIVALITVIWEAISWMSK